MNKSNMNFNQLHNSFNLNIDRHRTNAYSYKQPNVPRNISNVFTNNNDRTLPLPVKNTQYKYEKEYAILALNSKRVYKSKNMPIVLNTMNFDNLKNKTFRSQSTTLEDANFNKHEIFNIQPKKEEVKDKLHEKRELNQINTSKSNSNNKCSVCEKMCQSPSALKIHMAIHSDGKSFKCFFCDKFISKFASNRNRHMKQVHKWDNGRKK